MRRGMSPRSWAATVSTMRRSSSASGPRHAHTVRGGDRGADPLGCALDSRHDDHVTRQAVALGHDQRRAAPQVVRGGEQGGPAVDSMGVAPLTPVSMWHANSRTRSRAAHVTTLARCASGPSVWSSIDTSMLT